MKLLEGGGAATPLENNRGERLDTGTFYGWGGRADEEVMKVIGGGGGTAMPMENNRGNLSHIRPLTKGWQWGVRRPWTSWWEEQWQ
jgi:hypothetical protein